MSDLFAGLLIALTVTITLTALLTVLSFLLPVRTAATTAVIQSSPGRVFVVGLINLLFFGLLAAFLADQGEPLGLIALLILLGLVALIAIGLTGLTGHLQSRLYPDGENPRSDRAKTAVWLILAMLTPAVGWFLLAPVLLCISLGAAIATWRRRSPAEADDFS